MAKKLLLQWAAVAGALALVMLAGTADVHAGTFEPQLNASIVDTTAEKPSDFVVDFDLGKGDVQFGGVVAFIPSEWGIVKGDKLPIGAVVGHLTSTATLGLVGAACNTELEVEFEMLNSSIDIDDTVSFDDTNKDDTDNTRDYAKDVDENGLYDSIDKYPDFIHRVFDNDEKLQPIRRSAGISIVAGIPVLLQFLVFEPGTHLNDNLPDGEELGYPSVTLLQNAGDRDANPQPGAITDFCTPLVSHNESYGISKDNEDTEDVDESGYPVNVNPQPGAYTLTTVGVGQRDADNDSFENSFDTCPFVANVGDPRVTADGDLDEDGLDAACDPNDDRESGGTNSDEDGDGYMNRQDNCPLVGNGEDTTNQHDEDRDTIGDVCDTDPETADGELILRQPTFDVTIGGGGPGGPPSDEACAGVKEFEGDVICHRIGEAPTDDGGDDGGDDDTSDSGDDGGGGGGIVIVVAVVAALVVIGGGVAFMMRRRSS